MRTFFVVLCFVVSAGTQEPVTFDGRPALVLSNNKLALTMLTKGGSMVHLVIKDDPDRVNPLRATGRGGHFACVDGFGPVSPEERKAGLPVHGEANEVPWQIVSSEKKDGTLTVAFSAMLPLVQEAFRRTIRLVDGESVVYVESELENLMAFDRPINWGEHVVIAPPFLELGKTVVEMSTKQGMTRSHESQGANARHRLASFKEFTWPMAPGLNGGLIDVRPTPATTPVGDHTSSRMDPSRRLVFVTALHPEKRLLLGYVFRREEYPWTQLWESYPDPKSLARGLEFATQPFDQPRRIVIQTNSMLDTPTYRWLPAKSKIASSLLFFYVRTPEGFGKVDDVVQEGGKLTIEDRNSGKKITLAASRQL